jgi:dTDP-4-dehydrorhamnose reductase
MKILITGARSQLAQTIMNSTHAQKHELIFTARTVESESTPSNTAKSTDLSADYPIEKLDITDAEAVNAIITEERPQAIINCAGYTNVPQAEIEKGAAHKANVEAVVNLARAAKANDALLVHISTDYVYDGNADIPYKETDTPNPLNEYGRTKLAGDEALKEMGCKYLIFRISWLYSPYEKNFLKTILKKSKEAPSISVVDDQTGTPTYAGDLVDAIFTAIETTPKTPEVTPEEETEAPAIIPLGPASLYNYSNEGQCTWYEFAKEICRQSGSDCTVTPCKTEDYPANVQRPRYSVLDKTKFKETYNKDIPHWKESLAKCLKEIEKFG